jgi:hypothetical protein
MKKRRAVVVLCLVALATSTLALTGQVRNFLPPVGNVGYARAADNNHQAGRENVPAEPAQDQANDTPRPQATSIPTHVIYGMLFKEAAFFKEKAHEREQKGEDGAFFREYHRNKLKLDGGHTTAFERVAEATARKMSKLDERAKRIIDNVRAQHPGGKLKEGEVLPAPPAELKALNKERIDLLIHSREELRAALGEAEFLRLENLLLEDAARTIKPIQGASPSASFISQPETPPADAQKEGGE